MTRYLNWKYIAVALMPFAWAALTGCAGQPVSAAQGAYIDGFINGVMSVVTLGLVTSLIVFLCMRWD